MPEAEITAEEPFENWTPYVKFLADSPDSVRAYIAEHVVANYSDIREAHIEEDTVWFSVLCAIADGAPDAAALAQAALATASMDIQRYHA